MKAGSICCLLDEQAHDKKGIAESLHVPIYGWLYTNKYCVR